MSRARTILVILLALTFLWSAPMYGTVVYLKCTRLFRDDFRHFFTTSVILRTGLPAIYDDAALQAFADQAGLSPISLGSRTAPAVLMLLVPLTLLDLLTATRVFLLANHLMLIGSLFYARKIGNKLGVSASNATWLAVTVVTLISAPSLENLLQGQLGVLTLLSTTASFYYWLMGESILAGICLWPAISAKLFPGLFALYYLYRGDRKAFVAAVFSCILINLATCALFGWHYAPGYLQAALRAIHGGAPRDIGNQSLRALLQQFGLACLGAESPVALSLANGCWLFLVLAMVVVTHLALRRQRKSPDYIAELMIVTLLQFFLSSYSTSAQHLSLAVPAYLWIVQGRKGGQAVLFAVLIALLYAGDGFVARDPLHATFQLNFLLLEMPPLLHVLLWVLVVRSYWSPRREA